MKKRRQSTPPPLTTPQPLTVPVEEGLPVKLKDGQPLPIVPQQQNTNLSITEFQSIAERFVPGINYSEIMYADTAS